MGQINVQASLGRSGRPAEVEYLLEQVCRQILQSLAATSCSLSHWDRDRNAVVTWITYARSVDLERPLHIEAGESYALADYPATARVLQERLAAGIRVDDPGADPVERALLEEAGQQSLLMLPLVANDRVIGLLEVFQRDQPRTFSAGEIELAQALANQAALVIEGGQLFAEARREARAMASLLDAGAAIMSSLELEAVLRAVAEQMAHIVSVDGVVFSRLDESANTLSTWVEYSPEEVEVWQPDLPGTVYHLEEYPGTAQVLAEQQPLVVHVDDPEADPAERALLERLEIQSNLMVPVVAYNRVIGLVELMESRSRRDFSELDIALARALAGQAASAIENARLFRERERRIVDLAIVNELSQALASALGLGGLINLVHEQISRIFDTTNFYLAVYEEKVDEWTMLLQLEHGQRRPPVRRKVSAGLTGHIIRTRQPLLLHSLEENDAFHAERGIDPIGERAKSWLGVPLISADELVGVMALQSYEREYLYDENDLALFSTVAGQVASALGNMRLLEETRRRAREMEVINKVGQAITSVLDLDELLQQIVDITKERFGHYFSTIALVEGDQAVFRCGSTIGASSARLDMEQVSVSLDYGPSLVAEAVRTAEPVLVNDVLNDPRYLAVDELPDTRSELVVPILFKDRVIGTLDVQSDRAFAYDDDDIDLLKALTSQAASAIENARLFQERERRITELSILNEMVRSLSSALELGQVTQAIYEQVGRLFDTTNFFVALHDERRQEWFTVLDLVGGQPQAPMRRSVQEGLTGHIIRTGQRVLFHSVQDSEHLHRELGIERIGPPALSWLGVPMIAADRVVGVVAVESYTDEFLYSEDDAALLATVAAQAAISIENARLYGRIQEQLDELRRAGETQAHLLEQVQQMSTPIIPLHDRILLLPLIGVVDSERARQFTDRLLEAVRRQRARVVLLDITGVPIVDTAVAQALLQAAEATRLLGAEVVLVGVRAEVAQTLVMLGLDMAGLVTKSNLQAGIEHALGRLGLGISEGG